MERARAFRLQDSRVAYLPSTSPQPVCAQDNRAGRLVFIPSTPSSVTNDPNSRQTDHLTSLPAVAEPNTAALHPYDECITLTLLLLHNAQRDAASTIMDTRAEGLSWVGQYADPPCVGSCSSVSWMRGTSQHKRLEKTMYAATSGPGPAPFESSFNEEWEAGHGPSLP